MLRKFLANIFSLIARFATEPEDNEEWKLKKIIALTTATFGSLMYFFYGLLYIAFNEQPAGLVLVGLGVLAVLGLLTYGLFRHYGAHLLYYFSIFTVSVTSANLLLGGLRQGTMIREENVSE